MEAQTIRTRPVKEPWTRIQVVLTTDQLRMLNEASAFLHRSRSELIRSGIGDVLDRYYAILEGQKR